VGNSINGAVSQGKRNKVINCLFSFNNEIFLQQIVLLGLPFVSYVFMHRSRTSTYTWYVLDLVMECL